MPGQQDAVLIFTHNVHPRDKNVSCKESSYGQFLCHASLQGTSRSSKISLSDLTSRSLLQPLGQNFLPSLPIGWESLGTASHKSSWSIDSLLRICLRTAGLIFDQQSCCLDPSLHPLLWKQDPQDKELCACKEGLTHGQSDACPYCRHGCA